MGKSDLIEDETSLAYRLSNLRKDHDLSQKQLADQLHVAHSQISRIESGETKNPNISIVIDAARFFHVSTDYLFCLSDSPYPKVEISLTEEEQLLLDAFRSATPQGRFNIITTCMCEKRKGDNESAG